MSDSVDSYHGGSGAVPPGYPSMGLEVKDGAPVVLKEGEKLTQDHVLAALKPIQDPEIFLSIVDLGLVYGVDVSDDASNMTGQSVTVDGGWDV